MGNLVFSTKTTLQVTNLHHLHSNSKHVSINTFRIYMHVLLLHILVKIMHLNRNQFFFAFMLGSVPRWGGVSQMTSN